MGMIDNELNRSSQHTVTPRDLASLLRSGERLQLIDVRSNAEHKQGHIPATLNIPLEEVRSRMGDLRDGEPVVLICHSGTRAGLCKEQLDLHRSDVWILEGGTSAWAKAGLQLVGSQGALPLIRQVHIGAGSLILLGLALALTFHPAWIGLSAFVGAGLLVAGLTGFCGMAILLAKMPWNKGVTR